MKFTFKEWALILDILTHRAADINGDIEWREDYQREHEATCYELELTELRVTQATISGIIKKLENFSI